jgi:hypothetical protein
MKTVFLRRNCRNFWSWVFGLSAWLSLIFVTSNGFSQIKMNEEKENSFEAYASSTELSEDEAYTVELLIDRVRDKLESFDVESFMARSEARQEPNYKPRIQRDLAGHAAPELQKLSWLSLQKIGRERPVRNLTALRYLPSLEGLVLIGNGLTDITPVATCSKLRRLSLGGNKIEDLTSIVACAELEELEVQDNPIKDFSALKGLPKLKHLSIAASQVPALKSVGSLNALVRLDIQDSGTISLSDLPAMPELRVLRGAHCDSLAGIERFQRLENIINLFSQIESLKPLARLEHLTHANILSSNVKDLTSLAELPMLRELALNTDATDVDLAPLRSLQHLRNVSVRCRNVPHPSLEALRSSISSWDVEFLSKESRYTPSLHVEVVDQEVFDHFDTKERYGLQPTDTNEQMLSSERSWLDTKLEEAFSPNLELDVDYSIPFQWGGARSLTVVLNSDNAVESLPQVISKIQHVLCQTRND